MNRQQRTREWASLAVVGAMLTAAGAVSARGIGNDDCSNPQSIVGTGTFAFNSNAATTGHEGQNFRECDFGAGSGIANDEWFCWESTCNGRVSISTCGLTAVDTKIALYEECGCPVDDRPPKCCNDDACGRQSEIICDVSCGKKYMIQIGVHPGAHTGVGSFQIRCLEEECGGGHEQIHCGVPDCCGVKPQFRDQAYSTFTGQVMVMTAEVQYPPSLSDFALTVFDIQNFGTAPLNSNWNPPNFRYHDPSWTKGTLGSLFGVTLDDTGNIYASHTTCYNAGDPVGSLPGATPGSIFKIANTTGTPSVFANVSNRGPGLGNVSWDCTHDQIFVSNFEDGRIYRIASNGTALSAYDHATGTITPAVAGVIADEPGEPDGAFVPLGQRVWAVKKNGNRLFYSIWSRDARNINDTTSPLPPNQIWSIGLDSTGDFIPGTATLELNMPGHAGYTYSEPVSDISFSPDSPAKMLCAERNMQSDSSSYAHDSRLIEFDCASGRWDLSTSNTNVNGPDYGFPVGQFWQDTNSAGGCDYDTEPNGRLWVTGDALHYSPGDYIYGGAGILTSGATSATDILFDYNNDVTGSDKSQLGDVVIPCVDTRCFTITESNIQCNGTEDGLYDVTFTLTNHTSSTIQYLLFPDPQVSPTVFTFATPLAPGASGPVTIQLHGMQPGTTFCFDVILADRNVRECCHDRICFDIPRCDCIEILRRDVRCDPSTGGYVFVFSFLNDRPEVLEHLFLIPQAPHAGATVTPAHLLLGSVPPGGVYTTPPLEISGVSSGDTVCILISVHEGHMMLCCSITLCITIPPPCSVNGCPVDLNHDGAVTSDDFFQFIEAFFTNDPSADFDGSGTIDTEDLFGFMARFFTGCQ